VESDYCNCNFVDFIAGYIYKAKKSEWEIVGVEFG
jgi:hypothetical protein